MAIRARKFRVVKKEGFLYLSKELKILCMKSKLSLALSFPLIFLIAVQLASASSITRHVPDSAYPGQVVEVPLDVAVTGESHYLIDEALPAGWVVTDPGPEGSDIQPGHVKWVVIQNAASTSYTYEARAPDAEGSYAFSGTYMFEGMTTEGSIGGDRVVAVSSAAAYKPGFDTLIAPIVILARLVVTVLIYKSKSLRRASISETPKMETPKEENPERRERKKEGARAPSGKEAPPKKHKRK